MEIEKFSHWVQMTTGLAMIIGIILVLIELDQTRNLTRAQLASESASMALDRATSLIGENSMAALARACDPQENLTLEDALVLNYVFISMFQTMYRAWEMESIGGFDEDRWIFVANSNLPDIFATLHGRDWWKGRFLGESELINYGNDFLANLGPPSCLLGAEIILATDRKK